MILFGSPMLLCLLLSGASSESLNIDFVKSVLRHYRSRSVILILEHDRNSALQELLTLQKQLSINFYFSCLTPLSSFPNRNPGQGLTETILMLNPSENFPSLLEQISIDTTSRKWFLTTSTLTQQDFVNITIPPYVEFTIARGNSRSGYSLVEIYDTGPKEKLTNILGRWRQDKEEFDLQTTPDLFKRRKNLRGVAIKVISPKADSCDGTSFSVGIASIVWCIHQRLWGVMAEMLNATTDIRVVPNLTPDAIRKGDAELTFRSAPLNVVDLNTRDYVWPIFRVKLVKQRVEVVTSFVKQNVKWETYILPFNEQMWIVVLISMIFWDLILAFAEFITSRKKISFLHYLAEFSFSTAFTFFSQGILGCSRLVSTRIISLMIFIIPGVLFPAYSAVLTSFLTVQQDTKPFRNLEELSRQKEYKLGWHNTFALEHMFNLKDMSSLNQALLENNVLPQDELPATDAEGIERMCSGKFSYLTIKETILALKPKCRYFVLKPHFKVVFTSMEMRKNSWYKYFLDRCERTLHFTGVLYRIQLQAVTKYVQYDDSLIVDKVNVPPIKMENIVLPFAVLLLGVIGSFILLTLEVSCFNLKPMPLRHSTRFWWGSKSVGMTSN